MHFTKNQKLAIDLRGQNVLVSAAAGSGKTATLTERIIRLLTDKEAPADINRMLIVTFTRAAAGELRARISKKLSDALASDPTNTHLARQLTSLGGAKICTIDSYYLDLVKSNFQKLGIPSRFRLADETEFKILRSEVMNSVIERRYDTDSDFSDYADTLTTAKGESLLGKDLLKLADKILNLPGRTEILRISAERYIREKDMDYFESFIGRVMLEELTEEMSFLKFKAERLLRLIDENPEASPYGNAVSADLDHIIAILAALKKNNYDIARCVVFDYSPLPLGKISSKSKNEITEEIMASRKEIKEALIRLKTRDFSADPDDIPKICEENAALCLKTKEIFDDFLAAYNDEKASRCICEFSDLKRYALDLLIEPDGTPTKLAHEEQKKYDHIFVDEYQDTDAVQDLVFRSVSNGHNLFFVGDIKQSIYRFRGAEPSVFASYRKVYTPAGYEDTADGLPISVFMSENFRCSPNIISFTNAVCSYLFRETEGNGHGIGYVAEDDLIASRGAPTSEDKVKIVLLEKTDKSNDNPEWAYVIEQIKNILDNKTHPDGTRYKPRDIAILTRTKAEAREFANALAKVGIPHANSTGDDLFENPEVLLMLCLLSAADNPQRDIPLAGALKSPIFGFTMSDLVNIRQGRTKMSLFDSIAEYTADSEADEVLKNKCMDAIRRINEYRKEAEAMPVHHFMRYIWKDTNALSYAGSDAESKKRTFTERRRNLRKFYEYARRYEASSFKGLHDFVEYVSGIISEGTKITDEDAVTDETVQIMTVHKSKGLEFPTVFLVGCDKLPNEQDARKPVVFTTDRDLGIAFKISDETGLGQLDTPHRIAIADQMLSAGSEEEIRILYVALTRARDSLYVIASGNEGFAESKLNSALQRASVGGRYSVLSSGRWIDRILTALAADPANRSYTVDVPAVGEIADISDSAICKELDESKIEKICTELRKSFDFKYPHKAIADIPAKVSVSRLYPELLNEQDDEFSLLTKAQDLEPRIPRFMGGKENAAEKGTATHLFMQFCDFGRLEASTQSVTEEISRLVAERFINQDVADLIRINEIVNFVRTDIFTDIRDAWKTYREFRFNIFLPASNFTTSAELKETLKEEKILIQGVIDICYVNQRGELILCDYKTDRLSKAALSDKQIATQELSERHSEQLSYYSSAIEAIMGKKPDKIFIYSLAFGDALEINL